MKGNVKLLGFVLLAVGLAGLLLNEFVFQWGTTATILFALVEIVGFLFLAYARRGQDRR